MVERGYDGFLPAVPKRFNFYLEGLRSGSIHTRRSYNTALYEYLRHVLFERCELPINYLEIAAHVAYLECKFSSEESEIKEIICQKETPTIQKLKQIISSDFSLICRGNRFLMQLKVSRNPEKIVEIRKKDKQKIDALCSEYDPGPPECRETDRVCMDREFWKSLFRRDKLGEFEGYLRSNGRAESTVAQRLAGLYTFVGFLILSEELLSPQDDPFYRQKRPVVRLAPQTFLEEKEIY